MQRIEPVTIDQAPAESQPVLQHLKSAFGKIPNIFATLAKSPIALNSMMACFEVLSKGELAGIKHEAIGLRVSELNGCKYCLAAHTGMAKKAGANDEEIVSFRKGVSSDPQIQALLNLASEMVENRGDVTHETFQVAIEAGVKESELCEATMIVAFFTFTNYFNDLVQTEIDFPAAAEI